MRSWGGCSIAHSGPPFESPNFSLKSSSDILTSSSDSSYPLHGISRYRTPPAPAHHPPIGRITNIPYPDTSHELFSTRAIASSDHALRPRRLLQHHRIVNPYCFVCMCLHICVCVGRDAKVLQSQRNDYNRDYVSGGGLLRGG